MKRWTTLITVALVMACLNVNAWARGPHRGAAGPSQVTVEQRQAFWKDTETERQTLTEKQTRLNSLLASANSDPTEVGKLEKEIYGLRSQIQDKAQKAGFNCPGSCLGAGPGSGGMGSGRGPCFTNTSARDN